jgi:hypothetical protein
MGARWTSRFKWIRCLLNRSTDSHAQITSEARLEGTERREKHSPPELRGFFLQIFDGEQ